jgi:hypothetical protein
MGELVGHFLDGRDPDADGGISVIAVFFGGEVELNEVTGLNGASAGNAVHDFVIEADADVAGEAVNHWR